MKKPPLTDRNSLIAELVEARRRVMELEQRYFELLAGIDPSETPQETIVPEGYDPDPGDTKLSLDLQGFFAIWRRGVTCFDPLFEMLMRTTLHSVFVMEPDARVVRVNEAMEQVLGLTSSEIIGRTESELLGKRVGGHFQPYYPRVLRGKVIVEHRPRGGSQKGATFMEIRGPLIEQGGKIRILGMSIPAFPSSQADSYGTRHNSPAMQQVVALALLVAGSNSSVLLTGESGSGKDFLARFIHDRSSRASGPFESINCATIPHDLAESELFGHEKGAFSGANTQKKGLIELSDGGTLLLNEIGEMPMLLQAKLLTFLDSSSFRRVGGVHLLQVNTRILAATNRDLQAMIATGNFRLDLLHRLNVFTLRIPPLRERKEEIPELARRISKKLAKKMDLKTVPIISSPAMNKLRDHLWPGNVRELTNVLERAFVLSQGRAVDAKAIVFDSDAQEARQDEPQNPSFPFAEAEEPSEVAADPPLNTRPRLLGGDKKELHRFHAEYIVEKGWTRARLAEYLGIDSSTLKKWFKEAGLPAGKAGRPRKR